MVNLTIPVDVNLEDLDGVTPELIKKHLEYCLEDEDGAYRHNFNSELLEVAFGRLMGETLRNTVQDVHQEKYKGVYIDSHREDGTVNGHTAKWVTTSGEVSKRIKTHLHYRLTRGIEITLG